VGVPFGSSGNKGKRCSPRGFDRFTGPEHGGLDNRTIDEDRQCLSFWGVGREIVDEGLFVSPDDPAVLIRQLAGLRKRVDKSATPIVV
jgi:hypothetical protein